jgi:hypothetical protein
MGRQTFISLIFAAGQTPNLLFQFISNRFQCNSNQRLNQVSPHGYRRAFKYRLPNTFCLSSFLDL